MPKPSLDEAYKKYLEKGKYKGAPLSKTAYAKKYNYTAPKKKAKAGGASVTLDAATQKKYDRYVASGTWDLDNPPMTPAEFAATQPKPKPKATGPKPMTGKGGAPLIIHENVEGVWQGGYEFKPIPRKMNYKDIAQWFGLPKEQYNAYNTWIRGFSPFGTGEKFQIFRYDKKTHLRVLDVGTEVPVPQGSEWDTTVDLEAELMGVKSFWTVNAPHPLDKYDFKPVPLDRSVNYSVTGSGAERTAGHRGRPRRESPSIFRA